MPASRNIGILILCLATVVAAGGAFATGREGCAGGSSDYAGGAAAIPARIEKAAPSDGQQCSGKPEECAEQMRKDAQTHGWLGVSLQLDAEGQMRITKVWPGSPAERAGFRLGDQILSMNGVKVSFENVDRLFSLMRGAKIGEKMVFVIPRGPGDLSVNVTLEKIPDSVLNENIEKHIQDQHAGAKH